jgi:arylsulfatase A-like enzyme
VGPRIEPGVDADTAVITLDPRGLDAVSVTSLGNRRRHVAGQRKHRTTRVPLPASAGELDQLEISVPLKLGRAWAQADVPIRLVTLEVTLEGPDAQRSSLHEVRILRADAALASEATGTSRIALGGRVHPAIHVAGGVTATINVTVPNEGAELRWHDAGYPGADARTVRIDDTELARNTDQEPLWSLRTASLDRWAGKTVGIELGTHGTGVGLWGDPRVVPRRADTEAPDVLVVLADTLRADRLGAWGHLDARTPTLDNLAATGLVFGRATSASPWTHPSIVTLMSGMYATTHGITGVPSPVAIPETLPLVQERFTAAGWRSASLSASPLGSRSIAADRGYSAAFMPLYWGSQIGDLGHPELTSITTTFMEWVEEEPDRPFYAYVHAMEVHEWFRPRYRATASPRAERPEEEEEKLSKRAKQLALKAAAYDNAVAQLDERLEQLLTGLEGRDRELIVVFVSDHGEALGDHGLRGHGSAVYQSQVHVPMLFWSSRGSLPTGAVSTPVSLADTAPTLLDLFDLAPLRDTDGVSLAGDPARGGVDVATAYLNFHLNPRSAHQHALLDPAASKIHRIVGKGTREVSLVTDPCEAEIVAADPVAVGRLDAFLADQEARHERFTAAHPSAIGAVDAADLQALEALGYIHR